MDKTISPDLYDRVINQINYEHRIQQLKRRIIFNGGGFLLSIIILVPFSQTLVKEIAQSGLTQFLSLLFSDFQIISANLGDYLWTLIDSVPVVPLAAVAMVFTVALISLARLTTYFLQIKNLINFKYKNI